MFLERRIYMKSIGERIRYLRKEVLNKTQKDFGFQIGLKPNSVSDIESGKNNPTEQTIKAICREFGISYIWLTEGIEPMHDEGNTSAMAQIDAIMTGENEFAKNLFREFSKLDENEWKLLEKLIKNLSENIK